MPATPKIFLRIPPNASPEEKRRLVEEFARRLEALAEKYPEALKPPLTRADLGRIRQRAREGRTEC